MDKAGVVHMHNEMLLSYRKEEILPFGTTWMNLEGIMLSEKTVRERQILHETIYMQKIKKQSRASAVGGSSL